MQQGMVVAICWLLYGDLIYIFGNLDIPFLEDFLANVCHLLARIHLPSKSVISYFVKISSLLNYICLDTYG